MKIRIIFGLLFYLSFSFFSDLACSGALDARSYYTKLITDIESEKKIPSITDFSVRWTNRNEVSTSARLLRCRDTSYYTPGKIGLLTPECYPEILYSWGDNKKLQDLISRMGKTPFGSVKFNPAHPNLWATISPVASFCYGLIPVRIKLKQHVWFKSMLSRQRADPYMAKLAQFFSYPKVEYLFQGLVDFAIDDSNAIESWSFGTPEHYDEIMREVEWMYTHKRSEWVGYNLTKEDKV